MENPEDTSSIEEAKRALEEEVARTGKDSLETSYKLDALATALKEQGKLLEAANEAAKAKAIRAARFAKEADRQKEQLGDVSAKKQVTAVEFLKVAHRISIAAAALVLMCSIFLPSKSLESFLGRELLGSMASATLIQLLLFPIRTIPRLLKYFINAIISGVIWAILERL